MLLLTAFVTISVTRKPESEKRKGGAKPIVSNDASKSGLEDTFKETQPVYPESSPLNGANGREREEQSTIESSAETNRVVELRLALNKGKTLVFRSEGREPIAFLTRPGQITSDDFRISTVGGPVISHDVSVSSFEGRALENGKWGATISLVIVGQALTGVINELGGDILEIGYDEREDTFFSVRHPRLQESELLCNHESGCHKVTVLEMDKMATLYNEKERTRAFLETEIGNVAGSDPSTGAYTKYVNPIPLASNYSVSLKPVLALLVLDKTATGSGSPENLAAKTSQYLAQLANVARLYENQLGIRFLVQEVLLTPDTDAYSDVPADIDSFSDWVSNYRPRFQYRWNLATKFGDIGEGPDSKAIGNAFVGALNNEFAVSVCKTERNWALVAHEMGHNLGSVHSSGGVMNAQLQSVRDFFRDVGPGLTAAAQIYDFAKNKLSGTHEMRNPREIPFANDDFIIIEKDEIVSFSPLENDSASVRHGAVNTLSLDEVGRVFPIGSGDVTIENESIVFTPTTGFVGKVWFSYTVRGSVGNGGKGWLHKGDVAIAVGTFEDSSLAIEISPGDSLTFFPPGIGATSILTRPVHALADISLDDNGEVLLRALEAATGSESFTVQRGGEEYIINIDYVDRSLATESDVIIFSHGSDVLRFNPLANDDGSGARIAQNPQTVTGVGTEGGIIDRKVYFPDGFRLKNIQNLTPSKGTLILDELDFTLDGSRTQRPSENLTFSAHEDAEGTAIIEYTVEDSLGREQSNRAYIVFPFVSIVSPRESEINVLARSRLVIAGDKQPVDGDELLSGIIVTEWSVVAKPDGTSVSIDAPSALESSISFSGSGVYVIRLTGEDNGYETYEEVTVRVLEDLADADGQNVGPHVELPNFLSPISDSIPLDLSVLNPLIDDDGLPNSPGILETRWKQVSGPGTVTFSDPFNLLPTIGFSEPGSYRVELTVDDGIIKTVDSIELNYTGNEAGVPLTTGIADIEIFANESDKVIDLFSVFSDQKDSDADLVFSVETVSNQDMFEAIEITDDPAALVLDFASVSSGDSTLTIRATDTDNQFIETSFIVSYINAAPIVEGAVFLINENEASGYLVGKVPASDPDMDPLSYSIESGNINDTFRMENDGDLVVANNEVLDFETNPSFVLSVGVYDSFHEPHFVEIVVRLIDRIELPFILNRSPSAISSRTARIGVELQNNGGEDPHLFLYWGSDDGGTESENWENVIEVGVRSVGSYFSDLEHLIEGSRYFFRSFASNSAGGIWADQTVEFIADDIALQNFAIPGMLLWLDAADVDNDGISDDLSNGSPIEVWSDRSGLGYDATQETGFSRPVLQTNVLNGRPAMRFDGINDFLVIHGIIDQLQEVDEMSLFAVHKLSSVSSRVIIAASNTGESSSEFAFRNNNNVYSMGTICRNGGVGQYSTGTKLGFSGSGTGVWNLLEYFAGTAVDGDGHRSLIFANGQKVAGDQNRASFSNVDNLNYAAIGHNQDSIGGQWHFHGDIAEIILFERQLTSEEQQRIEGYLAHKWGIADKLIASHPFKDIAPTFLKHEYIQWSITEHRLDGAAAALHSDPDRDGLNNLLEFALGTPPDNGGFEAGVVDGLPALEKAEEGGVLFHFTRRIDFELVGLSYVIELATDLEASNWAEVNGGEIESITPLSGGNFERVTVRIETIDSLMLPPYYLRLKVVMED